MEIRQDVRRREVRSTNDRSIFTPKRIRAALLAVRRNAFHAVMPVDFLGSGVKSHTDIRNSSDRV